MKLRPAVIPEPQATPVASAVVVSFPGHCSLADSAGSAPPRRPRYGPEISHPKCRSLKLVTDLVTGRRFWLLRYRSPVNLDPERKSNCIVLGDYGVLDDFDAVLLARRYLQDLAEGRLPKAASISLEALFDKVVLPQAERTRSKRYCLDLQGRFDGYVRPVIGTRPVNKIHGTTLRQLADDYRSGRLGGARRDKVSDGTVNQIIALLKTIFREAHALGYLPENPAKSLPMLKLDNARRVVYSREEIELILPALRKANWRVAALLGMELGTGARSGELLDVRLTDLDLDARILNLLRTKSGRSMAMPLSDSTHAICVELVANAVPGNPYLFPASRGLGPMAPPRKVLQKVLAELGISSNRTFHDARRTAVTVAAHAPGVGVLAASRMANHADTRITEARYVVTADASVRLAVEAIAERLPLHLALASLPPEGLQPSPPITALSASAPADEVLPVRLPPQEQSDDSTET